MLRGRRGKKCANVNIIMGIQPQVEDNCSLNDSNIDNRNKVILNRSCEVVQDCNKLGMAFAESDDQLCVLAGGILRND